VDWTLNVGRPGEKTGVSTRPKVDQELKSMANSLLSAQAQPIAVRIVDGQYRAMAGYRRIAAALWLIDNGHPDFKLRCSVRENVDDKEAALICLSENYNRKELTGLQLSISAKNLRETFGLKDKDIAKALGFSLQYLNKMMPLAEASENIKDSIVEKALAADAAVLLATDDTLSEEEKDEIVQVAKARKVAKDINPNAEGKVTTAEVKDIIRDKKIKNGGKGDDRTLASVKEKLEGFTAANHSKLGRKFANSFYKWVTGKITNVQLDKAFLAAFPLPPEELTTNDESDDFSMMYR
jgi:ParB/RepB/Spo0J family partition protein